MVKMENEIGMLTEAREYTAEANKAFNNEVPKELMNYLKANKDSLAYLDYMKYKFVADYCIF